MSRAFLLESNYRLFLLLFNLLLILLTFTRERSAFYFHARVKFLQCTYESLECSEFQRVEAELLAEADRLEEVTGFAHYCVD